MSIMSGAYIWRESDLGVSSTIEKEFQDWLLKELPLLKLEEVTGEDIEVSVTLTVRFDECSSDDLADELISRPYSVYEVILNNTIGSSFYIREFEDNYSKTFVHEIQEYSPSAIRNFIIYGTHNEWNNYFDSLEEHVTYTKKRGVSK